MNRNKAIAIMGTNDALSLMEKNMKLIQLEKSKKIADWIKSNSAFKATAMCEELNINRGNFSTMINSEPPLIPTKHIDKIETFLEKHNYSK